MPFDALTPRRALVDVALAAMPAVSALAQVPEPPQVTAADYARAESRLPAAVVPLVIGGTVNATWLADGIPADPSIISNRISSRGGWTS